MEMVVTGAAGFLGSAVVRHLRAAGHAVHALSRRAVQGVTQVRHYADAPHADVLIHLAEIANRRLAEDAGPGYEHDAANTLAALLSKEYPHVVYGSSGVLYGDQHGAPCGTDTPIVVNDRYARIKRAAEQAVLTAGGGVARLANVYGPGMPGGTVLSTILAQIPGDGPLVVQDDTPVRDFLWIDDAAAAMTLMAERSASGLFNIGTGIGTSVRELATAALELAGQAHRPVVASAPRGAASSLTLDAGASFVAFRWQPLTPLREGLSHLVPIASERTG